MLFHIGEAFIKTKCVKLRKFSPPLISTQTIYKADTYKQIKSLSNYNTPGIFPEFFYFRFLKKPCKNIYQMAKRLLLWLRTLMTINILVITCPH